MNKRSDRSPSVGSPHLSLPSSGDQPSPLSWYTCTVKSGHGDGVEAEQTDEAFGARSRHGWWAT